MLTIRWLFGFPVDAVGGSWLDMIKCDKCGGDVGYVDCVVEINNPNGSVGVQIGDPSLGESIMVRPEVYEHFEVCPSCLMKLKDMLFNRMAEWLRIGPEGK